MTIRIETGSEQRCRVIVEGSMTIYEAAADKSVLLDALAQVKEAEIDLSSVQEMDTAGLQVLILAKRESLKAGSVVKLVRHSAASLDVLERYGLRAYFGVDAPARVPRSKAKRRAKATADAKRRQSP